MQCREAQARLGGEASGAGLSLLADPLFVCPCSIPGPGQPGPCSRAPAPTRSHPGHPDSACPSCIPTFPPCNSMFCSVLALAASPCPDVPEKKIPVWWPRSPFFWRAAGKWASRESYSQGAAVAGMRAGAGVGGWCWLCGWEGGTGAGLPLAVMCRRWAGLGQLPKLVQISRKNNSRASSAPCRAPPIGLLRASCLAASPCRAPDKFSAILRPGSPPRGDSWHWATHAATDWPGFPSPPFRSRGSHDGHSVLGHGGSSWYRGRTIQVPS